MAHDWLVALSETPDGEFAILVGLLALACLVSAFFGFRSLARARLLNDLPTSRIASASQGYLKLSGATALLPGPAVISPLTGTRCAWWDYQIERKEQRRVGNRTQAEWRTLVRATSDELFLLIDPSGECIVDPHGAKVSPSLSRRWQGRAARPGHVPAGNLFWTSGPYRYTERLVQLGDPLLAIGLFRTQHGVQHYDEREAVRELLAEWKRDQAGLLQRFDHNGDGQIDLEEWEAVRRAALEAVRQRHVEQAVDPDLNILSRPGQGDRRPYLLSVDPENTLTRRKRLRGGLLLVVAVVSFAIVASALELRFG